MSACSRRDKEKAQPINVFIRPRPLNRQEHEAKCVSSIEVVNSKEILIKQQYGKRYTFDKVFDMHTKQIDVYKTVVKPLIPEVIAGYNCTVFAYGQTGTGKTYTMAGGSASSDVSWQGDADAGIIPRAMAHLFDELSVNPQQYTVRVSYLELYNEELFDLLSDNLEAKNIRLYEDQNQKGSVIINGISTETVYTKNEVYNILQKGQDRRRTASTLLNAQSSRSHTVFMIMVHTCETTVEGEELVKTGKLNLVDLAGSENISRSGALDRRAREAGSINQSLLTLGRVIKALVEKTAHVPYRESKLTRILQDSLGGRTKTSIIATISPASTCLEETLSTLEYAYRARHITNRPEINQRVCQKAWKAQYEKELDKLRKDLFAARQANGIYLDPENYNRLIADSEYCKEELSEKVSHIRDLEIQIRDMEEQHEIKKAEWNAIAKSFEDTRMELLRCQEMLEQTNKEKEEQSHLAFCYESKAQLLHNQAMRFLDVTETNAQAFHLKVKTLCSISQKNVDSMKVLSEQVTFKCQEIADDLIDFMVKVESTKGNISNRMKNLQMKQNDDMQIVIDFNCGIDTEFKKFVNCASNSLKSAVTHDQEGFEVFFQNIISKLKEVENMSRWVDVKINIENARRGILPEMCKLQNKVVEKDKINEEILTSIESINNGLQCLTREINHIKEKVLQSVTINREDAETISNAQKYVEEDLSRASADLQNNIDNTTVSVANILQTIKDRSEQEIAVNEVVEHFQNCKAIVSDDALVEPTHPLEIQIRDIVNLTDTHINHTRNMFLEYSSSNDKIQEDLSELATTESQSNLVSKLQQCQNELHSLVQDGITEVSPAGSTPVRLQHERDNLAKPSPRERILSRYRSKMETKLETVSDVPELPLFPSNVLNSNVSIQNEDHSDKKRVFKDGKENKEL